MERSDLRVERKFVLGKYRETELESILKLNGFKLLHPRRKIESIYLDTVNYDFAKDNINGISKRKKIRFRWYNNNTEEIFLEEKNKENFTIKKNIFDTKLNLNKNNLINELKKYFYNTNNKMMNDNYHFILKISYYRTYWISENNKIRATIDVGLKTSPINDLDKNFDLNDTILEFKFEPTEEKYFREFFWKNNLNLRAKKYSKYLRSFNILDDCGLIN
tara:strand:+ start:2062 stop:2718 length:657 start_codon:yes stop_codon:yes gene_type:complete